MTYTVSITSQGQLTIPKPIRNKLSLNRPQKVFIEDHDDKIVIRTAPDFMSLMGSIKPRKKPEDWKAVDEAIADAWIEDEKQNI